MQVTNIHFKTYLTIHEIGMLTDAINHSLIDYASQELLDLRAKLEKIEKYAQTKMETGYDS